MFTTHCQTCGGTGYVIRKDRARVGCHGAACKQGKVPNEFGQALLDFISEYGFASLESLQSDLRSLERRTDALDSYTHRTDRDY